MKSDDEALQRELRDFILKRLSPQQASLLSQRISSDPHVARAYATLKLQMEMGKEIVPPSNASSWRDWLRRFWKRDGN